MAKIKNRNDQIIKVIYNIVNLKILKIIVKFSIINEDNIIKYLFFRNLEYLELPLYVDNNLFDFNLFFGNIPKLKTLKFLGFYLNDNSDIKQQNINIIDKINLNHNLAKNLKKIKFLNCQKKYSFIILKLIQMLSRNKNKDNIKELVIENCDFDENININDIFRAISSFQNIKNLKLKIFFLKKKQN